MYKKEKKEKKHTHIFNIYIYINVVLERSGRFNNSSSLHLENEISEKQSSRFQ